MSEWVSEWVSEWASAIRLATTLMDVNIHEQKCYKYIKDYGIFVRILAEAKKDWNKIINLNRIV